jgi:hypothetical protein
MKCDRPRARRSARRHIGLRVRGHRKHDCRFKRRGPAGRSRSVRRSGHMGSP